MEKLLELPPLALITLGVVLALIIGVRYLGLWQGERRAPAAAENQAQVAAVIVDPTALNEASGAVYSLTVVLTETNAVQRQQGVHLERVARSIEELHDGVDKLRDEIIRSSARRG